MCCQSIIRVIVTNKYRAIQTKATDYDKLKKTDPSLFWLSLSFPYKIQASFIHIHANLAVLSGACLSSGALFSFT